MHTATLGHEEKPGINLDDDNETAAMKHCFTMLQIPSDCQRLLA